MLTVSLFAQELKVKELTATNDLSASQYRRNDINGQPCALIKVGLAAEGAIFEGNVIQPVEFKSGEYWVYMTDGSLELRVKHPKFVPCHINFRDNGLERGVKSLTTYSMTLLLPQEQTTQMQKLIVNYTPASALVIIDSKPYQGNGRLELELPVGNHEYQVVAVGYATAEGIVKLNANAPRTINETLTAIGGETSSTAQSVQTATTPKRQLAPEDTARVKTFTVNGVSFNMIYVEGGTFTMGATPEQGNSALKDEKPAHQVTLSDYRIGETEVTEALWYAVMGGKEPKEKYMNRPCGKSWDSWQGFILKLNQHTGEIFRMPTEAEWEYAARGGRYSKGYKYSGSDELSDVTADKMIYIKDNHEVKLRKPNELGLYDMSGNAWEWVYDWESDYTIEPQVNPKGPQNGKRRIIRGGGNGNTPSAHRVSYRSAYNPQMNDFGLRLAL